jgi:hypothetical protein
MSSPLLVDILAYWNLNNNGSGGVSLVDSTGNGYTLTNNNGVTLGTGIIAGDAVFDPILLNSLTTPITVGSDFSISAWVNVTDFDGGPAALGSSTDPNAPGIAVYSDETYFFYGNNGGDCNPSTSVGPLNLGQWYNIVGTISSSTSTCRYYINGELISEDTYTGLGNFTELQLGEYYARSLPSFNGQLDEVGVWNRALSQADVTKLYNGGAGLTYPFATALYYNNAENDGDWGNLLNWWQDSGFTIQATALPDNTTPVNLYNEVTQNTQGANQCFCSSANFWSANFGAGLTLQSTGVVNIHGSSVMAGNTTDGVSMHDSSQLTATSVVDGNVVMRDSSRAFGSILGNATIYYDGGNGQFPIGGTVGGSVTYIGWPSISPQWFNDQATGGADDGDFANMANWWSDETYTTRPINSVGYQQLPDASTNVFIAPDTGIYANTGDAILVNSITANNGYISNITLTVSNGIIFSGNGNYGTTNAIIYADVTFSGTAYNDGSAIHGNADYKSSTSLVESFNHNSLGNLTLGASRGSNSMTVTIAGGGGTSLGTNWISRLLHLPWFINV